MTHDAHNLCSYHHLQRLRMSREPPCLSYLTIYNPILKPADPDVAKDDEDAEEQAQILFYTGKERAVSRDRILRQVGLAKALVNFAGMFNGADVCKNTHSQSRRMLMVSPEPNFWIHACVELARTPRQPKTKPNTTKGKAKESATAPEETLYEYHDGSLHDAVLRDQIMNAYQDFKLLHGSFTSILETLGQAALELQLERFFTVWAWQWDLEEGVDFSEHLGVPLHQVYQDIIPLIDRFAEKYTPDRVTFMLSPPNLLPSTAFLDSHYPSALTRHILRRIPPPSSPTADKPIEPKDTADEKATIPASTSISSTDEKPSQSSGRHSKSLSNPFANMDVRNIKWMWSGITFGKGASSSSTKTGTPTATPLHHTPEAEIPPHETSEVSRPDNPDRTSQLGFNTEVEIDAKSLQEAIESNLPSARASPTSLSARRTILVGGVEGGSEEDGSGSSSGTEVEGRHTSEESESSEAVVIATEGVKPEEYGFAQYSSSPGDLDDKEEGKVPDGESQETVTTPLTARPLDNGVQDTNLSPLTATPPSEAEKEKRSPPTFLSTPVFLPEADSEGLSTERKRVFHATKGSFTFALVAEESHDLDLDIIEGHLYDLFDEVQEALNIAHERDAQTSVLTVTKILEPQDEHVASAGEYTLSSTGFTSTSEHLFNARDVLRGELDVLEVFSRGQNPQHWHIGRRGIDMSGESKLGQWEVYMEVARKETTLTDVDNGLAGVVNRFGGQ
ncbi:hypothetical protein BDY19DRAFT_971284 [Irpex rosettiformis]|uniref:Uncharacterized protein n=1 Tax=Irpex rosettiformis TaxID=378272 RepID=A0ACB8TR13_9APHY|nr:hypothetical protein BDY19DRAFT_971284 [Irpex rosettiformis]